MDANEISQKVAAAQTAQRAGRRLEAARIFEDVLAKHGEHAVALNGLGMQALHGGRLADAAALFRRAIAVDPRSSDLYMNLAKAERERGDTAAERKALEAALTLDQQHLMALVRLAELLDRLGDAAGAAQRWEGVQIIAGSLEERPPAIEAILKHARDRVSAQRRSYADAIEAALGSRLSSLAWQDSRRVRGAIDHALGRRSIYNNVCAGLHIPFLPTDEYFDRSHFPWLEQIEAETDAIRAELESILAQGDAAGFRPYVSIPPGAPESKWTSLSDKLTWSALHLWKDGVRNDAACAIAPHTATAVERLPLCNLPQRTPTVFFSILAPGAHLPPHSGVSNIRTIVHLPLIVPNGCSFRVGGETRNWQVGTAWAFDDTIEHEAWNDSDELRGILIFDVWNPYLTAQERGLFRDFYQATDSSGLVGQVRVAVAD